MKVIDKAKAGPRDISDTRHEVRVMQRVGAHQYVASLREHFETEDRLFVVLNLFEGGMLFDRIVQLRHYSEQVAAALVANFLGALEFIHSRGVIHRDLKPENLLLREPYDPSKAETTHLTECALADFGLAGYVPGKTCCGSPSYIAPEVINVGYLKTSSEPYGPKCDVWSIGVITFILLSGKMPFHGHNFKQTFKKIIEGQWNFSGDVWDTISDDAKDFIRQLLTLDCTKRPSASAALQHPWLRGTQSDNHLASSIVNIKQFNAERKLKAAVLVFKGTSALIGNFDKIPPFFKYLTHTDRLSTILQAKSQTTENKVYQVNYGRVLLALEATTAYRNLLASKPEIRDGCIDSSLVSKLKIGSIVIQDCCNCDCKMVCRHIQNVHEYLLVGSPNDDMAPLINELYVLKDDTEIELKADTSNKSLKGKLERIKFILLSIKIFGLRYSLIQPDELKPNMMTMPFSGSQPRAKLLNKINALKG